MRSDMRGGKRRRPVKEIFSHPQRACGARPSTVDSPPSPPSSYLLLYPPCRQPVGWDGVARRALAVVTPEGHWRLKPEGAGVGGAGSDRPSTPTATIHPDHQPSPAVVRLLPLRDATIPADDATHTAAARRRWGAYPPAVAVVRHHGSRSHRSRPPRFLINRITSCRGDRHIRGGGGGRPARRAMSDTTPPDRPT